MKVLVAELTVVAFVPMGADLDRYILVKQERVERL
jgi:hypothetical protein